MSSAASTILTPYGVRGLKYLDRDKFLRKLKVPIMKVTEQTLTKIVPICKSYFLKINNFKPIHNYDDLNERKKCIFLHPDKISNWLDLSEEDRVLLSEHGLDKTCIDTKEIELNYDNWSYETIFKSVLPEGDNVSGFSQVGHIIHLNLKEHLLDYRPIIGQVLLDKIKTCRTVVNKSNIIDNTYRNFSMDIIAGEKDYFVSVKENKCIFQFDFSMVYWNSRLCKEHERILSLLEPNDVLFDIFCGVGPFAIPAAKKKCKVFANDLNPESYKWLENNAKINKINRDNFKTFNKDGKDFIIDDFKSFIKDYYNGNIKIDEKNKIHVTMNLPAMAVEFIKYFKNLVNQSDISKKSICDILVHVYCFVSDEDSESEAKKLVSDQMSCDMLPYISDVFYVRNVAPKKEMMRVTFKLAPELLVHSSSEPPCKKICV